MKNKIIIPTILFAVILVLSFFVLLAEKNKNQISTDKSVDQKNHSVSQIILFYGNDCPHCAIVEEYIKKNSIGDKISFIQKEVYYNQSNAKELKAKAKICGLPTNSIIVPFLWDGEKCFIGDQNIINFFKTITNHE